MDEHVSLREEARTGLQIGEGIHFLREARVQEAAFHSSPRPRLPPTSSDGFDMLPIVPIYLYFSELIACDFV